MARKKVFNRKKFCIEEYIVPHDINGVTKIKEEAFLDYYNGVTGNSVSKALYKHMCAIITERLWFYISEWDYQIWFKKLMCVSIERGIGKYDGNMYIKYFTGNRMNMYWGYPHRGSGKTKGWMKISFYRNMQRRISNPNLRDPVPHVKIKNK